MSIRSLGADESKDLDTGHKRHTDSLRSDLSEWYALYRKLYAHVSEHWGSPLTMDLSHVEETWLDRFAELNEECLDHTSVSDMLFVIRCFYLVIQHPIQVNAIHFSLTNIHELFAEVRILGCQNTKETKYAQPSDAYIQQLQLRVAGMVVLHFSKSKQVLRRELDATPIEIPESINKRVRDVRCLDFRLESEVAAAQGNVNVSDAQPGIWWLSGIQNVQSMFVPLASRIFHKIHFDKRMLSTFNKRSVCLQESIASVNNRRILYDWLQRRCDPDRELASELIILFRDMVFECALPFSTMYAAQSRKTSRSSKVIDPFTLLDNECGFQVLNRTNASIKVEELQTVVSIDVDHEYHRLLLTTMFHFMLHQLCKVKFIGRFYFGNQYATCADLQSFLREKTKWGMNYRPVILELNRKLIVCDVNTFDKAARDEVKIVEYVECVDIYEALLYWLHLMHNKYADELLESGTIKRLYQSIFQ